MRSVLVKNVKKVIKSKRGGYKFVFVGHSFGGSVATLAALDLVHSKIIPSNKKLASENSMHQLHTITDSLAHDLRSPLTAIRGKLEVSLSAGSSVDQVEPIVAVIEELDRLTEFLNKSLDVAESKADALRLSRSRIDLDELLRIMIDLYEPSMSERGLQIRLQSGGPLIIEADEAMIHRMIANLFDNELKHLPAASTINLLLKANSGGASLILEDDGPGFDLEVLPHLFERRVRGRESHGHGLGLAFVDAVARAHGGTARALNRAQGGARIEVTLPLLAHDQTNGVMTPFHSAH
jgi:signal transduction histidine kinase